MEIHLLQSKLWEKYEDLEGAPTFRLTDQDFDALVVEKSTPFGSFLFLPYGPALTTTKPDTKNSATISQPQADVKKSTTVAKNSLREALKSLLSHDKAQSAIFMRIEPTFPFSASDIASALKPQKSVQKSQIFTQKSLKSSNRFQNNPLKVIKTKDLDPHYTWVLDLDTQSEEEILKNMESRKVRYWRNAEKKGISIRKSQNPADITILTNFLKNLGEKDNFTPQTEQHLKNQLLSGDFATLYIAEYEEQLQNPNQSQGSDQNSDSHPDQTSKSKTPIAAALVYDFDGVRYYAHAATDFEHRNFQAGSILLIQMILDAKSAGQKIFDFWGITKSEDKNHPWYHFTQYKKSFGGREVAFSGTYDIVLNPVKYRLYQLARRGNRFFRKIAKK